MPAIDTSTVVGWGVDADADNDPTYPMRKRSREPSSLALLQRPLAQASEIEVLQSVEFNARPAVFGTGPAPSGASGALRRAAFRFSENNWWHWLLLLGADRVNMLEGVAGDLAAGRIPNVPAEMGIRADWQHNRAGLVRKVAVLSAVSAIITIGLARRRATPQARLSSAPRKDNDGVRRRIA